MHGLTLTALTRLTLTVLLILHRTFHDLWPHSGLVFRGSARRTEKKADDMQSFTLSMRLECYLGRCFLTLYTTPLCSTSAAAGRAGQVKSRAVPWERTPGWGMT